MANITDVQIMSIGGTMSGGNIDFNFAYSHGPVPHLRIRIYWKSRTQTSWKPLIARENIGKYYYYPVVEAPNAAGGSASLHFPPPNPIVPPLQVRFIFDSCISAIPADTIEKQVG